MVWQRAAASVAGHTLMLYYCAQTNVLDGARRAGTAASNFIDNVNGVLSCSELNGDFAAANQALSRAWCVPAPSGSRNPSQRTIFPIVKS